jgi:integrase-like protein
MVTPYANPQRSAGQRRTTAYIPDNGHVERLIGSIRRECLDHVVILGEAHLRRILTTYASYYNEQRNHRSLAKDSPLHSVIERLGTITSQPLFGGLHHQYCRI